MATAAYTNENALNKVTRCPDLGRLKAQLPGDSEEQHAFNKTVHGWIISLRQQNWDCISGVAGSLPCPRNLGPDCKPVGGLEFHVWRRMQGGQCREVAIAFRGTDKNELGDWISNFRWLYRLVPKFDQYYQVQVHIRDVITGIKKNGCGGVNTEFVSVGHSLGGGLAQQAAYAGGPNAIRYVYSFDPSPVTGFFDLSAMLREKSTAGLGVDRAFEAGEILALPRMIIENIYPPAACGPRIRTVRFNLLSGLGIAQHSMENLTKKLKETAVKARNANPRRVNDALRARACKGAPMMLLVPPA
jgi:hypothetical protein